MSALKSVLKIVELPSVITVDWLANLGACEESLERFKLAYPNGAPPTFEVLKTFYPEEIHWLGRRILSTHAWALYVDAKVKSSARQAYQNMVGPAIQVYSQATAPAWHAYQNAVADVLRNSLHNETLSTYQGRKKALIPATKIYNEETAAARKVYDDAVKHWLTAYQEACARILCDLVFGTGTTESL